MNSHWHKISEALTALGCASHVRLNPGASAEAMQELEEHLGVQLPECLKDFLSVHDGQSEGPGLVFGYQLLSTKDIRANWDNWRSIDEAEMNADCAEFMRSKPVGYIKPMYANAKWIPLSHDWAGNHVGLDFDPDITGTPGQVIRFGRDEDEKILVARTFSEFLDQLLFGLRASTWNGEYLVWPKS